MKSRVVEYASGPFTGRFSIPTIRDGSGNRPALSARDWAASTPAWTSDDFRRTLERDGHGRFQTHFDGLCGMSHGHPESHPQQPAMHLHRFAPARVHRPRAFSARPRSDARIRRISAAVRAMTRVQTRSTTDEVTSKLVRLGRGVKDAVDESADRSAYRRHRA